MNQSSPMKFSDAMLLGSTSMTASPGILANVSEQAGCALGMAAKAVGAGFIQVKPSEYERTKNMEIFWPWLVLEVARPCNCWRIFVPRTMKAKEVIAHIFDNHIFGKRDWSLDALAAWVASIEPAAEEHSPGVGAHELRPANQAAQTQTPY